MSIKKTYRYCHRILVTRPVTIILSLLIVSYITEVAIISIEEKISPVEAAIKGMPAFFGELGLPESGSFIVKLSMLSALFLSVACLTVITAKITTIFVELCRRGGRLVTESKHSNHVIICGWNFQGAGIVEELLCSKINQDIVILADVEQHPLCGKPTCHHVEVVKGDPTQDQALIKAGVKKAKSVIVLTDIMKSTNEADATALMITLAVESLNREAHTCVQIMSSSNRIHLERAHADEIICLDQMGGNLVVASATNHGVSHLVQELLSFNEGSEFYRYDGLLSENLVGKEFAEGVQYLASKRMVLLGFETPLTDVLKTQLKSDELHELREGNRVVVVNPQGKYYLQQGDALFLLAETAPISL